MQEAVGSRRTAHSGALGVDEIVDEMMQEVSRRDSAWFGGAPPPPPPQRRKARLSDLLSRQGADFVEHAYRSLLGREPDPAGARDILQSLAGGRDKIELLGALRWSPEGRRVACKVRGLGRRYFARRLYRLPVIGRAFHAATALPRVPRLTRDVARLHHALHANQAALVGLAEAVPAMQSTLRQVEQQLAGTSPASRQLERRLAALEESRDRVDPWIEPIGLLSDRQEENADRLAALETSVTKLVRNAGEVSSIVKALSAVRARQGWEEEGEALADRMAEAMREQEDRVKRAEAIVKENRRELLDQQRRLSLILEDLRRRVGQAASPEDVARLQAEEEHNLDALYVAFEDRFRGTRAEIKGRQSIYLPLLHEAGAGGPDRPIIDVGAGRGEFLELLKEEGLVARGVDLNRRMVEICTEAGLEVAADDAITYLAGLADGALGAVTGFHIIEHLPFPTFVRLLDESLRALASGGIVIFETPNPRNVLVGSRQFYLDPTHRNPIPDETAAMIAEARGFTRVSIRELHPMGVSFAARDAVLGAELDGLFHGPQDYALIAQKA